MRRTILLLILSQISLVHFGQIIADHTIVDRFDDIPAYYIAEVKKMLFVIAGESHAGAFTGGLESMEALDPKFNMNRNSYPDAPYSEEYIRVVSSMWGDYYNASGWIGHYGEEDWFTNATAISRTKAGLSYCNSHGYPMSVFGFAWCYDAEAGLRSTNADPVYGVHWYGNSIGSPEGDIEWGIDAGDYALTGNSVSMDSYIAATQAYIDYCTANGIPTKIFFTTGPVDSYAGQEISYQAYLKWEHLRDYVDAHPTAILFDYADILCYDNDGTPGTTTWNGHTYPHITATNYGTGSEAHIGEPGILRIGKALWWMFARIAGWDGGITSIPVTGITVTGASGATTITTANGTLQLSAAVLPANATNKTVTWSLTNGTGQGTINSAGLVTASANGKVIARATANDGSGIYGTLTTTISNQVIPASSIIVTSPNGGESWLVGSNYNITWTSLGTSGTVRIEYSTNNSSSWTDVIASTPDDGSQSWTIPNTPSTNSLVRVSDTDGNPVDISNSVFSITSGTSGGCINETFTAAAGTVTDNSGASDYLNNMSCEKLIQPSGGGVITLTFTAFNTEATFDLVRVYNGPTTSSPLLGTFSGNSLPPTLTSSGGSMLIRFTTDWGAVAAGWSATYTSGVPAPSITVTSPNGGESWQVGSNYNITWTSLGSSGTVRIEYSTNNSSSWTDVIASTPDDGSQSWTIPNTPSTNSLVRVSDTDGNPVDISNSVFSITSGTGGGCINETFTAAEGTVTDNSGASDYLNNMSCEKLIQPSDGGVITLTFTAFNTEATFDLVRVYNGPTTSSPLLGTFSGNSLPPTLKSSGGSMLIRFTTDWGAVAAGWSATYTSGVPAPSITVTSPNGGESWQVGSNYNITWTSLGTSGTVRIEYSTNNSSSWTDVIVSTQDDGSQSWTIPNTPSTNSLVRVSDTDGNPVDISNSVFSITSGTSGGCINETFTAAEGTVTDNSGASDYLNNMSCEKLIQPSDGGVITLTFTAFNTEATFDLVRVYNGPTTYSPLLGTFSGNSLPPTLTSSGGSMLIRFTTDWGAVAAGWSATYTSSMSVGAKGIVEISEQEILNVTKLVAYPNPTSGILTIESSFAEEETYAIYLINASGQVILNQRINVIGGKFDIDLSDVSYGVYLLRIMTNRTVQFLSVIKQ